MATPSVVEVDPNAPQNLSPIKDYTAGGGEAAGRKHESRKNKKNYKEMRAKYQEAKKRMDLMKEESSQNKRMLLEMSSVINALKDISIDYDLDESHTGTAILNVQKKVQAIDQQLKSAMMQCGQLEQEKEVQISTIKAQEDQIRTMKQQLFDLQKRLEESTAEKKRIIQAERDTSELCSTLKRQERKIAALEDQVRIYSMKRNDTVHQQIEAYRGANDAKYQEITAMQEKLEMLRRAQNEQSTLVVYTPTQSKKESKAGKSVSFASSCLVPLDRNKSQSTDLDSQSSHTSKSSHSSRSDERPSLASISEESFTSTYDEDLYSDDRGSAFSLRSQSNHSSIKEADDASHSIEITASSDDSVEIMVGHKNGSIDLSDVSYTTHDTAISSVELDYESEYKKTRAMVLRLQNENEKLRMNHSQALSDMAQISELTSQAEQTKKAYEITKKALNEQRKLAALAHTKCEKLRREHAKAMEELKEGRTKYSQLAHDYGRVAHREQDLLNYDKLKQIHDAVVMKMADMGDENETLLNERNEARSKLEQTESKIRSLTSELEVMTKAYQDLQKESEATSSKVTNLTQQCDAIKTKYYELLAGDQSMHTESTASNDERYETLRREYESVLEKLRSMEAKVPATTKLQRDYAEAMGKIAVLEQSIQELEVIREQFHSADAKVSRLERQHADALNNASMAQKREEERASHLKDLLLHYKNLERAHEEVSRKHQRLQAIVAEGSSMDKDEMNLISEGLSSLDEQTTANALQSKIAAYERRIQELQNQRDASIKQLNQLEDELSQARLEKIESERCRLDREQDLKVVLGHYRGLQKQYEALQAEANVSEDGVVETTDHSNNTSHGLLEECKGDVEGAGEAPVSELFERPPSQPECQAEQVDKEEAKKTEAKPNETANKLDDDTLPTDAPDDEVTENDNGPVDEALSTPDDSVSTTEAQTEAEEQEEEEQGQTQVVLDEDSVARLLVDMEQLKRHNEERMAQQQGANVDRTDMSSISNVSDGLSQDSTMGGIPASKSVLSDEAPSTGWKDVKIAKLMSELEAAKSQVWAFEEKEKSAQAQLESTERKLLIAAREAEDAKAGKTVREGHLRDAVAHQKRLEQDVARSQEAVQFLQVQLEKAKKEAKLREEETKEARKRAATYHAQYKRLYEKHSEAMKLLHEQEEQIKVATVPVPVTATAAGGEQI